MSAMPPEYPPQSPRDPQANTPLSEQDVRLAALLFQWADYGQRLRVDVLAEFDITLNELAVLEVLDAPPENQAHSQPALLMVKNIHAQLTHFSPSTLTRTLDSLEQKQWIVRSLNHSDRRSFQVALSEAGHEILDSYRATLTRRFATAARSLSSGERMLLTELLERILAG